MNTPLLQQVRQWGIDKGITGPEGKGTIQKQFRKFVEEMAELFAALEANDTKEIRDALGDLQVVAVQANSILNGLDYDITIDVGDLSWYATIEDLSRIAISELSCFPTNSFEAVRQISHLLNHDPDECLQEAYDVISKRTGKMVDGVFVKDNNSGAKKFIGKSVRAWWSAVSSLDYHCESVSDDGQILRLIGLGCPEKEIPSGYEIRVHLGEFLAIEGLQSGKEGQ